MNNHSLNPTGWLLYHHIYVHSQERMLKGKKDIEYIEIFIAFHGELGRKQ